MVVDLSEYGPEFYGNSAYGVYRVAHPDDKWYRVYGVVNKETGMIESFTSRLIYAKLLCDEFFSPTTGDDIKPVGTLLS